MIKLNIREQSELFEEQVLSSNATLSKNSKGRQRFEEKCSLRTDFARDRDRIVHSKAFRRLKHKTQVFISLDNDHFRTRLIHTLEVSQIARTVAHALRLNEDLVEAIALGHDLGHTPFGHSGERALNDLSPVGFKHYEQSLRVVDILEKDGEGMNLTFEVRDGIKNHTGDNVSATPEGKIIKYADRIAYINHDIDDAIRAGVISANDLPCEIVSALGNSKSERINTLVKSIVDNSKEDIVMDEKVEKYYLALHEYLFEAVYKNPVAKSEEEKVLGIVEGLFNYFKANPKKLSDEYLKIYEQEGADRAISDYIAGMTDHYAITIYSNIYIPKAWSI